MKISTSVRNLYDEQHEINDRLKGRVDGELSSRKEERWHYESRLKSPESFALKIETGRVDDPSKLEDFFACTLVVQNKGALARAEALVKSLFQIVERRPRSDNKTAKPSNAFPFDDLRIYCRWRDEPDLPPKDIAGVLFEVQIKTFLQHAWAIATHDLTYKSDKVSWAKERIAFQIKAMLEHAEISIQEAERLATSAELSKQDWHTEKLLETLALLNDSWNADALPQDKVSLARNVHELTESLGVNLPLLKKILEAETKQGRGIKTLNLSPYGIVVQALLNQRPDKVMEYFSTEPETTGKKKKKRRKVFLPTEIELPPEFTSRVLLNVVLSGVRT